MSGSERFPGSDSLRTIKRYKVASTGFHTSRTLNELHIIVDRLTEKAEVILLGDISEGSNRILIFSTNLNLEV